MSLGTVALVRDLLAEAGVELELSPHVERELVRVSVGDRRYLILEDDGIFLTKNPVVVLGATREADGVLRVVALGETGPPASGSGPLSTIGAPA